ncbi:MAG: hypothetical protein KF868_09180 [Acidobacteria bacterium]|nr:hypothetical protein [Acidobacteriota bacterium]MCW5968337.1 hypothetical protein [Blastocatellales bacterium]
MFRTFLEIEHLVGAFERAEIAPEAWDHRSHVVVACWYLLCYQEAEAVTRMRDGIHDYLRAHGIATTKERGYHETITLCWMRLVRAYLAETNLDCSLVELINRLVERFADKDLLLTYYSRERLFSWEARTGWMEPDLRPLPEVNRQRMTQAAA